MDYEEECKKEREGKVMEIEGNGEERSVKFDTNATKLNKPSKIKF